MLLLKNLYLQQETHFVLLEGSSHLILRLHSLLAGISSFLPDRSIEENVAAAPKLATHCDIGCQLEPPPILQLEQLDAALSLETRLACCLGKRQLNCC